MQDFAVKGTKRMLKEYGETWVVQNRVRLIEELEQIADM